MLVKKGLEGLAVDDTAISTELPEERILLYRGYSVAEVAENLSYLETLLLLWQGDLPTKLSLEKFAQHERSCRHKIVNLYPLISNISEKSHPMDVMRTAISFYGASAGQSKTAFQVEDQAVEILAISPGILAAFHRLRSGLKPLEPREDLSFSDHLCYLHFGRVPSPVFSRALEVALILYAENAFAPSTFTARVVTSSQSDIFSAICAAICSLKGPLHGGANELVMQFIEEARNSNLSCAEFVKNKLQTKARIMGFGHRIFRFGDPRVPAMMAQRDAVARETGNEDLISLACEIERLMLEEKKLFPNIDFPAGPLFYMLGFDRDLFTPLFAIARIAGWVAHILEQRASNRLYNPIANYVGHPQRKLPFAGGGN